jgi:hypothetical protein
LRVLSLLLFFAIATLVWLPSASADGFNNPLVDAADLGKKEQVQKLLRQGSKPDSKGDFGTTALMRAAFRGNLEIVHILIESGAYVDAADIGGETALHIAARTGHTEIVEELLNSDAFIDIQDKEKWTPLMRAVKAKRSDIANMLIKKGADLTLVNEMNESVLMHAAIGGKPEIVKMILGSKNYGKIPKEQQMAAIAQAEKKGHEETGRLIASAKDWKKSKLADTADSDASEVTSTKYADSTQAPDSGKKPAAKKKPKAIISVKDADADEKIPDYNPEKITEKSIYDEIKEQNKTRSLNTASAPKDSYAPRDLSNSLTTKDDSFYDDSFYTMQFGVYSSEDRAFEVWTGLQSRNDDVLGRLTPNVLPIASNGKNETYYLRSGHYRWKDIAESTCSSLRTRNIECLVVAGSVNQYSIANRGNQRTTPASTQLAQPQIPPVAKTPKEMPIPQPYKDTLPPPPAAYQANNNNAPKDLMTQNTQAAPQAQTAIDDDLPWTQTANYTPRTFWPLPTVDPESVVEQQPLAPIAEAPTQYQPVQTAAAATKNQADIDADRAKAAEEVRQAARKDFFNKSGVPEPKSEKSSHDFYKDIEKSTDKKPAVSEAILVPDETYFANSPTTGTSGSSWIQVGDFGNPDMANDYADRMFRYDESLGNPQIIISNSMPITIKVGPISSLQASNLCDAVEAGSMRCSKSSTTPTSSTAATSANKDAPKDLTVAPEAQKQTYETYWINLGTFSDASEAEYYWAFLREDNQDLIANLKYNLSANKEMGESSVQLKVGPMPDVNRAKQICNVMKYRNIACLVQ